MKSLDRIDCALLDALQKNARCSNKELAAGVGLSQSSCLARVRRLESEGILRGFHAEVDAAALGIRLQAMVMVRLGKHERDVVEAFRDHMLSLAEVVAVSLVGGAHDYFIQLAVPDTDHLKDFELQHITNRPEVEHIETILIFEHHRSHGSARLGLD